MRRKGINEKTTRDRFIDVSLRDSGWTNIVDFKEGNKYDFAAVREYETENGPADYVLFHNGKALAAVEAKKLSLGPQNVLVQAERYSKGFQDGDFDFNGNRLPFVYSTNGEVIWFRDLRRKNSRSYKIAKFHTPQALEEMLQRDFNSYEQWLDDNPVAIDGLREYQKEAVESVEDNLITGKRKMLLAMATGTGKTFTACSLIYRLLKSGFAKRILFLVDRRALAAQAVGAFSSFTPEPGLRFDKIYEVYSQKIRKEDISDEVKFDPKQIPPSYLEDPQPNHTFVYVCTIQRMMINLFGRGSVFEFEEEDDEADKIPMPIHAFDLIIADECHRGYTSTEEGKWRQVLDHFDAVKVGLTATPAAHTKAYFNDIVYKYTVDRAVREGWLVDYDIFRIKSDITMNGFFLKPGEEVSLVDPETGKTDLDVLEDEREYNATDLERKATAPDRNKKIVKEFAKFALDFEKEHGRFPKSLFFAMNDLPHRSHADMLVNMLRDEFNRGDDFVQKITGSPTVDKPLQRIREFRNRPDPAIVVTVDMLSTGVDIPKLENIVFVRPVKSRILFDQMMGRGTRLAPEINKDHFTVHDAVRILEYFKHASDFTADPPDKPRRTLREVVDNIYGNVDRAYNVKSLVRRLQRVAKNVSAEGREMFEPFIPGGDITTFARKLPDKLDKDWGDTMNILRDENFLNLMENYPRAKQPFLVAEGTEDKAESEFIFRSLDGREYKPEDYITAFERFVKENPDHIEAIKILLGKPSEFSIEELKELRAKLSLRPERFTEKNLRKAYHNQLADLISMVKHAAKGEPLTTAQERVDCAISKIKQELNLTEKQEEMLNMIKNHLVENLVIDREDFNYPPFSRHGSWKRADEIFEGRLPDIIQKINVAMIQCRM